MTALDQRPPAAPAATDDDVSAYLGAARPYVRAHPGNGTGAVRAGITAVLDNRQRHPSGTVHAGLMCTDSAEDYQTLRRHGWVLVGLGTHRLTGATLHVLERGDLDPPCSQYPCAERVPVGRLAAHLADVHGLDPAAALTSTGEG